MVRSRAARDLIGVGDFDRGGLREPIAAALMSGMDSVHPARRYNYWLGGADHFAADRESGDLIARAFPTAPLAARENRDFLRRSVHFLASAGIRQFLDVGTGLPVPDNTHEIARRVDPASRILYVDNDPIVKTRMPAGIDYLEADLREPELILTHARRVLDLAEPVGLLLVAVLHFLHDDAEALAVVRRLLDALPVGSYLVASNLTLDYAPPAQVAKHEELLAAGRTDARARDRNDFGRFFAGLELVDPGIAVVSEWRRTEKERPTAGDVAIYGAVGRLL